MVLMATTPAPEDASHHPVPDPHLLWPTINYAAKMNHSITY
jgi:hypothetical protein